MRTKKVCIAEARDLLHTDAEAKTTASHQTQRNQICLLLELLRDDHLGVYLEDLDIANVK